MFEKNRLIRYRFNKDTNVIFFQHENPRQHVFTLTLNSYVDLNLTFHMDKNIVILVLPEQICRLNLIFRKNEKITNICFIV